MRNLVSPDVLRILEQAVAGTGGLHQLPLAEARARFEAMAEHWNEPRPSLELIRDYHVAGSSADVPVRVYSPDGDLTRPVVVFVHGGSWTFGSIRSHDTLMRHLALLCHCTIVGVDYRLAPENRFPAPLEDVLAVIRAVEDGQLPVRPEPGRIAIAGDSAGAHLSLLALLHRRDAQLRPLAGGAFFYGAFAPVFDSWSHDRFGDGSFRLGTKMLEWSWEKLLGVGYDPLDAAAVPLHARLEDLPALHLVAAGADPLLEDTLVLSRRLAEAGVRFQLDFVPGHIHGFLRMMRDLPEATKALERTSHFLRDRLGL